MEICRQRFRSFLPFLALLAAAWLAAFPLLPRAQEAGKLRKLSFSKTLKGSVPEYMLITVDSNGSGSYDGRKLDDPPNPRAMQVSPATTRQLFELCGELNNLRSVDLESHRKVANLGLKILTYQGGGQVNRVEFNFTQNRVADELVDLFEKIASVEQHISSLEYAIKYDPLGLPRELLQIQIDFQNNALADPEQMVPTLEKIVRNPRFLHLAQARAQNILRRLQVNN